MSFYEIQRRITLVGRLLFFLLLFFSFRALRLPALPFLSPDGTAAFIALLCILPLGHASSFRFMAVSNLTLFALVFAIVDRVLKPAAWYEVWRTYTMGGFLPFFLCALLILAGHISARHLSATHCTIPTPHPLPGGRLRIVQISDLHPPRYGNSHALARLYRLIDEAQPDLVALTGDIFDENTTPTQFRAVLRLLSALRPKYGIFYVFGNHDASYHWKKPSHTKADILTGFDAIGVTVLEDSACTVADGAVRIVGRRERDAASRLDPADLLGDGDGFQLLLCHEPVELADCAAAGADLTLAGHTHGGQIFPLGLISTRLLKLHDAKAGKVSLPGGRYAIVSSGAGTWSYAVRTESRSEIVVADVYTKPLSAFCGTAASPHRESHSRRRAPRSDSE